MPSNPFDASTKAEVEKIVKAVCATFTKEYVKAYALALVAKAEEDANEEPSPYLLLERPEDTSDLKSGNLTKEGAIRKSWKKRWFVVRYDYNVDYYPTEADTKKPKAKPKGSMGLAGYYVISNVNDGLLKQATELAEKMGMNVSELPKPKQYPEHTFELHHYRRRCYFIQCASVEEKREWVKMFETVCWRAYGLRGWKDQVHVSAFHEAVRKTRWELGRWGWWSYGGNEEQILSDLIATELDYEVMYKMYGKITGPWVIRNGIRNQILKTLDTLVSAAVTPGWKLMDTAVKELRPKIEPTLKETLQPLFEKKKEIVEKMKDAVLGVVNPILEEHVTPHLGKILEVIKSPMVDAFEESYKLFDAEIEDWAKNHPNLSDLSKGFERLDYVHRSYLMWRATDKVDVLYDPLWLLRNIFTDIYPWSLIWGAHNDIRKKMDNAMYTFEEKLKKSLEENANAKSDQAEGQKLVQSLKEAVLQDFKHDGEIVTLDLYVRIMKAIVMPPLNKLVVPACKQVLQPLDDLIPEPMKQLVDIMQMFDDLVDGIVTGICETILKGPQNTPQQTTQALPQD